MYLALLGGGFTARRPIEHRQGGTETVFDDCRMDGRRCCRPVCHLCPARTSLLGTPLKVENQLEARDILIMRRAGAHELRRDGAYEPNRGVDPCYDYDRS
jgi:hypothetical protein